MELSGDGKLGVPSSRIVNGELSQDGSRRESCGEDLPVPSMGFGEDASIAEAELIESSRSGEDPALYGRKKSRSFFARVARYLKCTSSALKVRY